jgi:spermidine synthase
VLILGGGDGLAVREVLKYQDVERIHLVDIDPEMIRIAKELPMLTRLNEKSLSSDRVTVFTEDAFTFINQPGIAYDRVIIDMPDPHNEAINKLYSREFYTMIKRRMSPDGLVVTQSSSPFFTRNVFWCIEHTLASVFTNTLSYHVSLPSFGIWGFNMARASGAISNQFEFNVPTRAITAQAMLASTVFSKDMGKVQTPVNSIMEPELYQLYIEDLRR